jgi:hypothetical protein
MTPGMVSWRACRAGIRQPQSDAETLCAAMARGREDGRNSTAQCNNIMCCSGGDLSCFDAIELTAAELQFKNERAGGNYGAGTKELQERNYIAQKELERKRKEMFEDALADYRAGKVEEALVQARSLPA